jgi:O-antigen ligase
MSTLDLRVAARFLFRPASAALVILGTMAGLAAERLRPSLHQRSFAVSAPKVICPEPVDDAPRARELRLSASLLEGYAPADVSAPPPLRDIFIGCLQEAGAERTSLLCTVRGPDADRVDAIARAARVAIGRAESSFANELADLRLIQSCGLEYFARLAGAPPGSTNPKSGHHTTPAVLAARAPLLEDARLLPPPPETPPSRRRGGSLIGAVAGALLAALAAGWRARAPAPPAPESLPPSRLGRLALAGLMLTAGMDTTLALHFDRFTVRTGQLFALVLLAAAIAERRRLGRALTVEAAPFLAALGYLCVCAVSALQTDYPAKSVGYLAWASFDLLVVFAGIRLHAGAPGRLESALRWWWAGMALGASMGFLQIVAWRLGYRPPLVTMDNFGFPRINGFNYEPSYFALYLVPGALVLLTRFTALGRRAQRSAWLAGLLILAVALSTSRSGWIGLGIGLAALLLRAGPRLGPEAAKRLALPVGAVLAVGAIVLASWPALRSTAFNMARMGIDVHEVTSAGPRIETMRQAFVLFTRAPLLGVGFGNYGAYVLAHPELPNFLPLDAKAVVTTNLYLEIASETGAIGLCAAVAALFLFLRPLWRRIRERGPAALDVHAATAEGLLLASLVVFLVLFQFSQTLWRLDIWVLLSLGLTAASAESSSSRSTESGGQRPAPCEPAVRDKAAPC